MYRRGLALLLAGVILLPLLAGCGEKQTGNTPTESTGAAVAGTAGTGEAGAGIPPDGDPDRVTCQGSYTRADGDMEAVVATVEGGELTNGLLQVFYWMEVAVYRQAGHEIQPEDSLGLDQQPCEIDSTVNSWQQYFLQRALTTWHSAQALTIQGEEQGLPTEEAYQPDESRHEEYMTGMPATEVLYGYNNNYTINSLHQAYLDNIPAMLEDLAREHGFADASQLARNLAGVSLQTLEDFVRLYNTGYMYFTALSYSIDPSEEEVESFYNQHASDFPGTEKTVDIRLMLLVPQELPVEEKKSWEPTEAVTEPPMTVEIGPDGTVTCPEALWENCLDQARDLVKEYETTLKLRAYRGNENTAEGLFAELANKYSRDESTALDGGAYDGLRQGQLPEVLDSWCFDDSRQIGDMEILRTDLGYCVVYFCGSRTEGMAQAREALKQELAAEQILQARENYPARIDYSAISLGTAEQTGDVSWGDLLYPDVGHQRYTQVPLYLQQDYPDTKYGAYPIRTNGCGITTLAMLASYMSDTELTPPAMCERYGSFSYSTGTDGFLFSIAPGELGFYLKEQTYDWRIAKEAMKEGYIVVTIQQRGYWTGGGHYLLLEKLLDDDTVQVRDSNIFNYSKLEGHDVDRFPWSTIPANGYGYWIYQNKVVTIPACHRCGEGSSSVITGEYLCRKCQAALERRNAYLCTAGETETAAQ